MDVIKGEFFLFCFFLFSRLAESIARARRSSAWNKSFSLLGQRMEHPGRCAFIMLIDAQTLVLL